MKKCIALLTLLVFAVSCDDEGDFQEITIATPIVQSKADLRAGVAVLDPQPIQESEKIYAYQDFIFVGDSDNGFHVIDNSVPTAPVAVNYIKVPLHTDLAIRNDVIYANSGPDLVTFAIQPNGISQTGRFNDVLDYTATLNPGTDQINQVEFDFETQLVTGYSYEQVLVPVRDTVEASPLAGDFASAGGGTGTGGSLARFLVYQEVLYTLSDNQLTTFTIGNDQPVQTSQLYVNDRSETLFQDGTDLFIGTATGMFIYDVTTPSAPLFRSQVNHGLACDPVVVDGDYAYVTLRGGTICNSKVQDRLEIVDISDRDVPFLANVVPLATPYGLGVFQDQLFICQGENGLSRLDLATTPQLAVQEQTTGLTAYDVIPLQDRVILTGGNVLRQYSYDTTNGLVEISSLSL